MLSRLLACSGPAPALPAWPMHAALVGLVGLAALATLSACTPGPALRPVADQPALLSAEEVARKAHEGVRRARETTQTGVLYDSTSEPEQSLDQPPAPPAPPAPPGPPAQAPDPTEAPPDPDPEAAPEPAAEPLNQ